MCGCFGNMHMYLYLLCFLLFLLCFLYCFIYVYLFLFCFQQTHLECAHNYGGMWQHMHMIIDQQLRDIMEAQYRTLNKKLEVLSNSNSKHNEQKRRQFQPKIINLSNTPLTKEQTDILSLGHS